MHQDRLNFLAYSYPVRRAIVSSERNAGGHWDFQLACGHSSTGAAHFDLSKETDRKCWDCSVENVKTHPRWTEEFKNTP